MPRKPTMQAEVPASELDRLMSERLAILGGTDRTSLVMGATHG